MAEYNINLTNVQPTLVSGTNIKTINGESLLGSGDITTPTVTFGTSGQIPFTNATGDDYDYGFVAYRNNRLEIGGVGELGEIALARSSNGAMMGRIYQKSSSILAIKEGQGGGGILETAFNQTALLWKSIGGTQPSVTIGNGTSDLGASLGVKGSDNTTGVNTLLTSADGTELFKVLNDNTINLGGGSYSSRSVLNINMQSSRTYKVGGVAFPITFLDTGNNFRAVFGIKDGGNYDTYLNATSSGDFIFTKGVTTELARLTSTGLGIGTTTPRSAFDVASGNISWGTGATTATYLNIPNGGIIGWSSAAVHYGIALTKQAWFGYSSSANFIFSTTGQVVVGGTIALSGSPKFGVKGADNTTGVNTLLTSLDGTELFKVLNNGNVGIGNTSPSYKLDVIGDIRTQGWFYATSQGIRVKNGSAASPTLGFADDGDMGIYRITTNTLGFSTAAVERMRIDSSGNIGIGTTSPTALIHSRNTAYGSALAQFETSGRPLVIGAQPTYVYMGYGNREQFKIAASSGAGRFILGSGLSDDLSNTLQVQGNSYFAGNVGIGTTSPTAKLQVVGSDNTTGVNTLLTSLDGTERFKLLNNGNVALGNTSSYTWDSFYYGIDLNTSSIMYGKSTVNPLLNLVNNANFNTSQNWVRKTANEAVKILLLDEIKLQVAPTGAAGSTISWTDGLIVKNNGGLNAPNLPTSSAGLSAGDIWNDGGTLKIV